MSLRLDTLGRNLATKHKIDFSLVSPAIILIEFSVFITQLSNETSSSIPNLIVLRIIHTALMLLTSFLVSQAYIRANKTELEFRTLAITGILVMAFGDLTHSLLATYFDIELVSVYRRIGIVLIQGSLWFPAFIIIGGNRKEILYQFKEYKDRLLVATRTRNRTSPEFKDIQKNIQDRIRSDFYLACADLKKSITQGVNSGLNLTQKHTAIMPLLVGDDLRKLSRELEGTTPSDAGKKLARKNGSNIRFLIQEFRYLYASITRSNPLQASAYAFVLIALTTPLFINFYSLPEFLITFPMLVVSVFALAQLIVKSQSADSPVALRNASILIFLSGLFPFAFSIAGQALNHGPQTPLPIFVAAIALPVTYYLCMEAFQVLRPSALSLVRNDELKASDSLQIRVSEVAIEDFTKYLNQQWAVYIHGKILTRLAATSLKLQAAASSGDSRTFTETLRSLDALLSKPDADFEDESTYLQEEITSRLDPWRGLLEINVHIDQDLKSLRNVRVKEIGEVIEELVSNSIRHGKAKKIDLRIIRAEEGHIEIIAIDNALIPPPKSPFKFGLGTHIFNLVSDGRWSITRVGLFTEFNLMVAID